nr:nuclear localization sequence-binding protein [Quercus suber]
MRFAIRRCALRVLSHGQPRQVSNFAPLTRVTSAQSVGPSLLRSFHQSRVWLAEKAEASPAKATVADETVTTEPAAVEESMKAQSASKSTPETLTEQAKEYASSAVNSVSAAASSTAAAASSAATAAFGARVQQWPGGAPGASPNTPTRILYVGNLFFEVTTEHLEAEFAPYGKITNSRVVTDPRGMSRGFGYVEFADQDSADRAVRELDQKQLQGRRMAVQYHIRRERRPDARVGSASTQSRNPPSKTLFIGNMSYQMSDRDLNDLFREIRNVLDVRVAIDRRSGQPRGFAHADFIDVASAEQAKEILQDKTVYGRPLRVDFSAQATQQRSEGGS